MTTKDFCKTINKLEQGKTVKINAAKLTNKLVYVLRGFIQNGILVPDEAEVRKITNDIKSVMDGTIICPQMVYQKAGAR